MTLPELFRSYLLSRKGLSAITAKNYTSDIRRFMSWYENNFKKEFAPENLTSDVISFFIKTEGGLITSKDSQIGLSQQAIEKTSSTRSFERYLSSLRKLAEYLTDEKLISKNPFLEISVTDSNKSEDAWDLKGFKDHLYTTGASKLTIKNYMVDINAFTIWAESSLSLKKLTANEAVARLTPSSIEEYKTRLVNVLNLSPLSVNRKLSTLRRYLAYAQQEGIIENYNFGISNEEQEKENEEFSGLSLDDLNNESKASSQEQKYSSFPPFRLGQKIMAPYAILEDKIAGKIASKIKHKNLEEKAKKGRNNLFDSIKFKLRNYPKEYYAPHAVSLASLPLHKKIIHHARYTRPEWYKKYHNNAVTHYFHFAILVIYASIVGFIIYTSLFLDIKDQNALAAPTAPPRILSFQGRLTDANDNPITTATDIRFQVYDDSAATGAGNLLWQEVIEVSPDQDGIFSELLGNGSTCPSQPLAIQQTRCAFPADLFTDNATLYLGITIESTSELSPRQRLAAVAYAANSEALQGMLPITDVSAGTTNVVLALDSSGDLTIGGSATPTFQATGGQFAVTGQTLLLSTNTSSNGNVQIVPDGLGKIDVQKPLVNSTATGNITPGGVEINDKFGVLATESAVAAFVVNNNTTGGDIFTASSSGTTRFTIENDGDLRLMAGAAVDTITTGTLSIGGTTATTLSIGRSGQGITLPGFTGQNGVLYGTNGTGVVAQATTASTGLCLLSGAANPAWGACPGGSTSPFWNQTLGVLHPNNLTVDFTIGGQATASADFAILNVNGTGPVIASVSGNLIVMPKDGAGGQVGIGTTSPIGNFNVNTGTGNAIIDDYGCSGFAGFGGNTTITGCVNYAVLASATDTYLNRPSGGTLYFREANSTQMVILPSTGNVGIATTGPDRQLDVLDASDPQLRLTQSDGTVYTDLQTDGSGNLVIDPTGTGLTLSGTTTLTASTLDTITSAATLGISATTLNLGAGSAATIGTVSDDNLTITPNGTGELTLTSDFNSGVNIGVAGNTPAPLSVSGGIGNNAALIVNNTNNGNLFAASSSGTTNFIIENDGDIIVGPGGTGKITAAIIDPYLIQNQYTAGNTELTFQTMSASNGDFIFQNQSTELATLFQAGLLHLEINGSSAGLQIGDDVQIFRGASNRLDVATGDSLNLVSGNIAIGGTTIVDSSRNATFENVTVNGTCSGCLSVGNISPFQTLNGAIIPNNSTVDFIIGGQATASANFAILNVNGTGPATATVSGNLIVMPTNGAGGNVGLGTISPDKRLVVQLADASGVDEFKILDSAGTTIFTIDSDGNTLWTSTMPTINFNNANTIGFNDIDISDPGAGEGFGWTGTSPGWIVDVSPLDRSNADGNLNLYGVAGSGANNSIAFWRPTMWVADTGSVATASASTTGLNFTTSLNGNITFNPGGTGNIGIGTTVPSDKLTIDTNATEQYLRIKSGGTNYVSLGNADGNAGYLALALSGTNRTIIDSRSANASLFKGAVNIGGADQTLRSALEVSGLSGTTSVASISGTTSFASQVVDNSGVGDIFTASKSGATKFTIQNSGIVNVLGNLNDQNAHIKFSAFGGSGGIGAASGQLRIYQPDGTLGVVLDDSNLNVYGASFSVGTSNQFAVSTLGAISAATGITSSGSIIFSTFSTNGGLLYTNGSGQLSQITSQGTTGTDCLVSAGAGAAPTFSSCAAGVAASIFWSQTNGALYPKNSTVDFLVGGQSTASAKFAVTGINDGTPVATISASTNNNGIVLDAANSTIQSVRNNTLTFGGATTGNIAIGTDAKARTVTIGNSTGATALNFTSGTGAQTFTSLNATATSFSFLTNSLTTGTGLSLAGNALTSGNLASLTSTSTALTSGGLLSLDWSPGSSTTGTGDLFSLNIGANGNIGNLFNIKDSGSSLFSVSETAVTSNLPASFNSAGDVSIAYDLVFTNPTASYIKSSAPLAIYAGETYNSSNLTLGTYNVGNVVVDSQAFVTNYAATISGQLVSGTNTAPANIGGFYLTNSSTFGKALAILNQTENQHILTASSSGTTNFIIENDGDIIVGPGGTGKITAAIIDPYLIQNQYTAGNTELTFQTMAASNGDFIFQNQSTELATLAQAGQLQLPITGSTGGLLLGGDVQLFRGSTNRLDVATGDSLNVVSGNYQVGGTTVIDSSSNATFNDINITGTCGGCVSPGNISPFQQLLGAIVPTNSTVDFLVGGQATASAKFAVTNITGSGTPTASVSGGLDGYGTYLTAAGNLATTRKQTLSLGGTSTGRIQVLNSSGSVFSTFDTTNSRLGLGSTSPAYNFEVESTGDAGIYLEADTGSGTEDNNAFLKLSQDATVVQSILGTVGDAGFDPENNAYTNTLGNATLLGTLDANGSIQFGTNDAVRMTIIAGGSIGIGTTGPDAPLDVLSTGGTQLRLTYADGSTYTTFNTNSSGDLTIAPSGGDSNITGTLDVSGHGAFGTSATVSTTALLSVSESITDTAATLYRGVHGVPRLNPGADSAASLRGLEGSPYYDGSVNASGYIAGVVGGPILSNSAGTLATTYGVMAYPVYGVTNTTALTSAFGFYAQNSVTGGATITNQYGLFIADQTSASSDYGIAIAGADTQALWIGSGADNTDAANGIAFGSSRDTNLYRSAANTLKTDDAFNVNGNLNITSAGAISAATGITSSGSITFSTFSTNGGLLYTNGSGLLTQLTTQGSSGECLLSGGAGAAPSFSACGGSGVDDWDVTNGVIYPKLASTLDFILGSSATSSAEFAVTGINAGTPTATISATTNGNGISLTGSSATIQSLTANTLTLGGTTTGNIALMPLNSSGNVGINTASPLTDLDVRGPGIFWNNQAGGSSPAEPQSRNAAEFLVAASSLITIGENSAGDANPAITLYRTSAGSRTGTGARMYLASSTFDFRIQQGTNATAYGSETYTDRLVINGTGTGIGTSGPDRTLDVLHASSPQLRLTQADGTVYSDFQTDSSGNLLLDVTGTKIDLADDLEISGNDILDSSATSRITLGATTTLTNTSLTLSGTSTLTASSLATIATSSTLALNGASTINTNQATLSLFDTTATTLTFGNAATTLTLGATTGTLNLRNPAINVGGGSATTISTVSDDNLTLTANGTGELTLTSDFDSGVNIGTSANTPAPLSVSGGIGNNAAFIVDQLNSGNVIAASASGINRFIVSNAGALYVNDDSNANMTQGATLNQGASDDEIFALKSSDVNHGITGVAETDTYADFLKLDAAAGGIWIRGLADSGGTATAVEGLYVTDNTTKTSAGRGVNEILASKKSGTGRGAPAADTNLFALRPYTGAGFETRLIIDYEGTIHQIPGSDTSVNLLSVGVTGTPTLAWDETGDEFDLNKGLDITGVLKATGAVTISNYTTNGGLLYTNGSGLITQLTSQGTAGDCLTSGGAGAAPSFASCGGSGVDDWDVSSGAIYPKLSSTLDFLVGSSSTASAEFAVTGINDGTPVATISASTNNNGLSLTGSTATIQSVRGNTLNIGGTTTGLINVNNKAGTAFASFDTVNSRFGIGTTTPDTLVSAFQSTGTAGDFIHLRDTADTADFAVRYDGSTNFGFYSEVGAGGTNWINFASGGNIGAGTTGPDRKIDILDASNAQLRLTQADGTVYTDLQTDSSGNLIIDPTGTGLTLSGTTTLTASTLATIDAAASLSVDSTTLTLGGDATINGGTAANGDLTLQGTTNGTRATSYVNLQPSGGLVGIGLTAPISELQIDATSGDPEIRLCDTGSGCTSGDGLEFGFNASNGWVWNYENTALVFATNNAEQLRIAANGDLIVNNSGTTTTSTGGNIRLNVNTATNNNTGFYELYTVNNGATAGNNFFASYTELTANDADADLNGISVESKATAVAAADSYECLFCAINSEETVNAVTAAFRVTGATGAESITNGFHVGTTDVTTDLLLQNGETIDNNVNGTLNIGTTTLTLAGTSTLTASSLATITSGATLGISATTLNLGAGSATTVNAGDLTLGYNDTSATISTTDTDENLTLDPNGTGTVFFHGATYGITSGGALTVASCTGCGGGGTNLWQLGTGTLAPGNLTQDLLVGSAATSSARIRMGGSITGGMASLIVNQPEAQDIFAASSSGTTRFRILNDGTTQSPALYDIDNTAYFLDPAATGDSLIVAGAVGIGTVDPQGNLEVYSATPSLLLRADNNSTSTFRFLEGASGATAGVYLKYDGANNELVIQDSGTTDLVTFERGGGVGIGVMDPDALLQVDGTLKTGDTGSANGRLEIQKADGITYSFDTASGGLRMVGNGGTQNFSITGETASDILRVGIGTLSPTAQFQVLSKLGTNPVASFSGTTAGPALLVTNDGVGDLFAASASGSVNFRVRNNGDLVVGNGAGKITNGTFDPLYTIDGGKFSTYAPSMIGVKEEITGDAQTTYDATEGAYKYTLDFNSFTQQNNLDLWVFSRASDPDIGKISVLLTPNSQARTWYRKDPVTRKLTFYSDRPTRLSYRLTAPRFDHLAHGTISSELDTLGLVPPPPPNAVGTGTNDGQDSFFASVNIALHNGTFRLIDGFGNAVYRVEAFSNLIAANLTAGMINTQKLTTGSLNVTADSVNIAGQSLRDYVAGIVNDMAQNGQIAFNGQNLVSPLAEIDSIKTNTISPLATNTVEVDGNLDITGDASVSGDLTATNLNGSELNINNDATISGTLYADRIKANSIEGLEGRINSLIADNAKISTVSAQTLTAYQEQIATASGIAFGQNEAGNWQVQIGEFLDVENFSADFATFRDGLISLGPSTFNQITALDSISVGTNLTIGGNSINTLGQDLEIQPLKQGAVSFLAGAVRIETDGTLYVTGDAYFAGKVNVEGELSTGLISPIGNSPIKIASGSAGTQDGTLLSVDGSIAASGSATFNKLNLSLAQQAYATSDTEATATGSAGTAILKQYRTELTVNNPNVTENSLIYITPVGNTNNKVLYLLRQVPGESFTVGVSSASTAVDIKFNWIIVN